MYLSRFVSKQFLEIRKCFCFCGKLITYVKGVCESGGEGVGGGYLAVNPNFVEYTVFKY